MDDKVFESVIERLKASKSVLVALPKFAPIDTAATGLALTRFLMNAGKDAKLGSARSLPNSLAFLSTGIKVDSRLDTLEKLIIKVNTQQVKLGELTYETVENEARVFLSPKEGAFTEADITIERQISGFDCIITVGAIALEDLGELYTSSADLFFGAAVINIGIAGTNEYFGAYNLVDVTSVSLSEIAYDLMRRIDDSSAITKEIATGLLAALISKTHSFQDVRTTPKIFALAAELMDLGGNHQEAVQHLFKTKPLPLLQVWGRALARLKTGQSPELLISELTLQDLEKTDFENSGVELKSVLFELMENVSGFKAIILFVEKQNSTQVLLALHPQINAEELFEKLSKKGTVSPVNFYSFIEMEWDNTQVTEVQNLITPALQALLES